MNPVVEMENVVKYYDQKRPVGLFRRETHRVYALNGVSFSLEKGDLCAYAGPNGAGKSTTFKLLSGMLSPQEGKVSAFGANPAEHRIAMMQKTGVLFGNRSELWWDHPVRTSFLWKKQVWGIDDRAYAENLGFLKELLDLDEIWTVFARELSLGQRMRAELCGSLLHGPALLFLDEPTIGLDAVSKLKLRAFLREENAARGTTILLTTHDMEDMLALCRRVLVLGHGRLLYDGALDTLLRRYDTVHVLRCAYEGPCNLSDLPRGVALERDGDGYVLSFAPSEVETGEVLSRVLAYGRLREMTLKEQNVDQLIARMYQEMSL